MIVFRSRADRTRKGLLWGGVAAACHSCGYVPNIREFFEPNFVAPSVLTAANGASVGLASYRGRKNEAHLSKDKVVPLCLSPYPFYGSRPLAAECPRQGNEMEKTSGHVLKYPSMFGLSSKIRRLRTRRPSAISLTCRTLQITLGRKSDTPCSTRTSRTTKYGRFSQPRIRR